jgi:hypothetical protein
LGQIIKRINAVSYQICTTAGTSGGGAEPAFSDTAGTTTGDNTVTWTSLGAVGNFGAFAAPHQRILNADAATWSTVAGSDFYISSSHAETQASAITLAGGQGTASSPNRYICVSNATAPPTAATTGASVSTTSVFALTVNGTSYYEGIKFSAAGGGSNNANLNIGIASAGVALYFENCQFAIASTNAIPFMAFGNNGGNSEDSIIYGNGCTFTFGATGQTFKPEFGFITIVGGSMAATGSIPTTLISLGVNNQSPTCVIRGCDLSTVTGTLCAVGSSIHGFGQVWLENCKLGAAVTMTSGTFPSAGGPVFRMHNCDSGSKNYRFYEASYLATIQQETTTTNNAGASDGTQIISWNIATTANTKFAQPYVSPEITEWQDTTGSSKTATVEIAGANTLNNDDIWLELEYLGNASFPIASTVSSRKTDALASNAAVTTSSATWGGSPAHTQKLQVTFTPQMKGPVKARVFVAKASATIYVDPLITIT